MKHIFFSTLLVLLVSAGLQATTLNEVARERGLEIAKERKARDRGWGASEGEFTMVLRNARGQSVERNMLVQALEMEHDGDKALTVFRSPNDVRGSAFLSHSHALTADDQWIYLPAVRRVKRIASQNKSGPFMGSEFAFEDMTSFEVEKFEHALLDEMVYNDMPMYLVQQIPTDTFSGYSKQVLWVDKSHYRVHKVEFYDRRNSLLKVLKMEDYHLYRDKFWRPKRAFMENVQTGKSTELITEHLTFDVTLTESDFNESSLRRAR